MKNIYVKNKSLFLHLEHENPKISFLKLKKIITFTKTINGE